MDLLHSAAPAAGVIVSRRTGQCGRSGGRDERAASNRSLRALAIQPITKKGSAIMTVTSMAIALAENG